MDKNNLEQIQLRWLQIPVELSDHMRFSAGTEDAMSSTAANSSSPLDWKFSQVFGERRPGEDVENSNSSNFLL